MALTHGPRLGAPASSGFKVWCRFDGAATITLETRLTGAATWNLQDTQAVETAKDNTVVLTATGLNSRTKYDYRVLENAVERATNTTWTMPTSGRFVAYVLSDIHGVVANMNDTLGWIKTDFETNYEPLSIPAVLFIIGDLFLLGTSLVTPASARLVLQTVITDMTATVDTIKRIPLCYIADDHDYAGNNCAIDVGGFTVLGDANIIQDEYWRERPRSASPSWGSLYTICDVPFIVADQRSQKWSNRSGHTTDVVPDNNHAPKLTTEEFPRDTRATTFGTAQRNWIIDTLIKNSTKSLVVMVSTTTFTDPFYFPGSFLPNPCRDGINCYYVAERNYILETGCIASGYSSRNNLVIWSGDDHYSCVWDWTPRLSSTTTGFDMYKDPRHIAGYMGPLPGGLRFREFKVRSAGAEGFLGAVAHEEGDLGVVWRPAGDQKAVLRWDITSTNAGENVTARVTYFNAVSGAIVLSPSSIPADFYFENGHWEAYDANAAANFTTMQAQINPGNGMGGVSFNRWYEDTINGTLHPESMVTRDTSSRLRYINDLGDLDRDDILESWDPRAEEEYPDP